MGVGSDRTSALGLHHLSGLTKLETLILTGPRVSGAWLDRISQLELPSLRTVEIAAELEDDEHFATDARYLVGSVTPMRSDDTEMTTALARIRRLDLGLDLGISALAEGTFSMTHRGLIGSMDGGRFKMPRRRDALISDESLARLRQAYPNARIIVHGEPR